MTRCAPQYAFRLLGRKWTFRLLEALEEPLRFNEFLDALPGLTNHVLSGELQLLADEQLLVHEDEYYRRTEPGAALLAYAQPLIEWAQDYQDRLPCDEQGSCEACDVGFQEGWRSAHPDSNRG